jgi:hypothetical protein
MKRLFALSAILLFAGGTIIVPAVHQAGMDSCNACCSHVDHSETEDNEQGSLPAEESAGDSNKCPICDLAGKSYTMDSVSICPVEHPAVIENISVYTDSYVLKHFSVYFHVRAPPASA